MFRASLPFCKTYASERFLWAKENFSLAAKWKKERGHPFGCPLSLSQKNAYVSIFCDSITVFSVKICYNGKDCPRMPQYLLFRYFCGIAGA